MFAHVRAQMLLAALLVLAGAAAAIAAPKTDVIELVNGDRITCEITRLERGKLTVETDGLGTIAIEWDDIDRVTSKASYDIELATGQRLFGSLSRGDSRTADIVSPAGIEHVPLDRIVRISPVGGTFWRRLDGSLDAGFSFAQANLETQWTFHSNVRYRSRLWYGELAGDSSLTTSEDQDRQTRNSLLLQGRRYLRPLWSIVGLAQFQQNKELSLTFRGLLGGGAGRVLNQSNRIAVSVLGAVAFTREEYDEGMDVSIVEGVAGLGFQWFTFDGRSTNLSVDAMSYYALDGSSRTRLELNTTFRSDIVGDLYWSVNTFESHNSEPPQTQKSNDFGIAAAIGWSF
jgi:hypothetical protein